MKKTTEWLSSQNKFNDQNKSDFDYKIKNKQRTISVASGKGGVGKTSVSLKIAKLLSKNNKTLLVDCDANLSNTAIKLGLPVNNNFYSLVNGNKNLDQCLYKDGNFHLLSACNGDMDLLEAKVQLDDFIINIISQCKHEYRYVILDCSADISKTTLNLNAYSDDRFVVVTPDKSSITDSYSLIKILAKKYGIKDNYLIVNKISNTAQFKRIVKILGDTVDNFIGGRLKILGSIPLEKTLNSFDSLLLDEEKSSIHHSFVKLTNKYAEMLGREKMLSGQGSSLEKKRYNRRGIESTIH